MRVGIITGGGDAPGLNGIIESTCRTLLKNGVDIIGIQDGFDGIFESRNFPITYETIRGIHSQAGTLLGTSNKTRIAGRESEFISKYKQLQLDGLIVAGGDGTFSGLKPFEKDMPILGVPKTIDNDLAGTEITFGYDTACSVVADAVDSLRFTAKAHKRIIVVEAMGRTAGWIALGGGLAGYADVILLPERPFDRKKLLGYVTQLKDSGRRDCLIVAAEGAHAVNESEEIAFLVKGSPQAERYGGIAASVARWLEKETTWEARHVVLGHLQRATQPTTTDRFLTLAMGAEVARMCLEKAWGNAAVFRDGRVTRAPVSALMGAPKLVTENHRWVKLAEDMGIFV